MSDTIKQWVSGLELWDSAQAQVGDLIEARTNLEYCESGDTLQVSSCNRDYWFTDSWRSASLAPVLLIFWLWRWASKYYQSSSKLESCSCPAWTWTLITAPLGLDSNSTDDLIIIARSKLSVYNDIQPLLLSPLYNVLIDQIFWGSQPLLRARVLCLETESDGDIDSVHQESDI